MPVRESCPSMVVEQCPAIGLPDDRSGRQVMDGFVLGAGAPDNAVADVVAFEVGREHEATRQRHVPGDTLHRVHGEVDLSVTIALSISFMKAPLPPSRARSPFHASPAVSIPMISTSTFGAT
jgi:hypothetical protein